MGTHVRAINYRQAMTETPGPSVAAQPLVDAGNTFLGAYPSNFMIGVSPDRKVLILTIRSGPATLTVLLDKDSAGRLINDVTVAKSQLTDLIVPGINGADIAHFGRHGG
jgi:hypothetical protein